MASLPSTSSEVSLNGAKPAAAETLVYADGKVIGVRDVVIDHGDYSTSWNVEFISAVSYNDVFPAGEFYLGGDYTYAANQALMAALSGLTASDLLCTTHYSFCRILTPHLDYFDEVRCAYRTREGYVSPTTPCSDGVDGYHWVVGRYDHMASIHGTTVHLNGQSNTFGLDHQHDTLYTGSEYAAGKTNAPDSHIWAKWTPTYTPQPVPEPGMALMLVTGILVLAWLARKSS